MIDASPEERAALEAAGATGPMADYPDDTKAWFAPRRVVPLLRRLGKGRKPVMKHGCRAPRPQSEHLRASLAERYLNV